MTSNHHEEPTPGISTDSTAARSGQARSAAELAIPGIMAFTIPLVGFLVSLLLPIAATRARVRLWPRASRSMVRWCGALAVIGLWLPALVALAGATNGRVGLENTMWLVLPLCAPAGAALIVPAICAVATYIVGLVVSAIIRRPWPWVLGALTAPLAYSAASLWLVDFACRA